MDERERNRTVVRTGLVGIAANALLVTGKLMAGLAAGSIAIVLDALNNLTDALSSIITIVGVRLASKPADREHPFGHGRIEYLSAMAVSGIVLSVGLKSLWDSARKVMSPEIPSYSTLTLTVVISAIFIKLFLGKYTQRKGEQTGSASLKASGADALFDAVISAGTLLSVGISMLWGWNLDAWIGMGISVVIIKAGVDMLRDVLNDILGKRVSTEMSLAIKKDIGAVEGVLGVYDLFLDNYGPQRMAGSVHVEICETMGLSDVDSLLRHISSMVFQKYGAVLTCGFYAVPDEDSPLRPIYTRVARAVSEVEGVLGVHGLRIDRDHREVCMDVVKDFSVTERQTWIARIEEATRALLPGYTVLINPDLDLSD